MKEHPPSFFSLSSVSLFSASFSYSSLSHFRRKSKFFVCRGKKCSRSVAVPVPLEKLREPPNRHRGGPRTFRKRSLSGTPRGLVYSGPQPERLPRFHCPCAKALRGSSRTWTLRSRRGVRKSVKSHSLSLFSSEKPPQTHQTSSHQHLPRCPTPSSQRSEWKAVKCRKTRPKAIRQDHAPIRFEPRILTALRTGVILRQSCWPRPLLQGDGAGAKGM